jgi:hypothetical protein
MSWERAERLLGKRVVTTAGIEGVVTNHRLVGQPDWAEVVFEVTADDGAKHDRLPASAFELLCP